MNRHTARGDLRSRGRRDRRDGRGARRGVGELVDLAGVPVELDEPAPVVTVTTTWSVAVPAGSAGASAVSSPSQFTWTLVAGRRRRTPGRERVEVVALDGHGRAGRGARRGGREHLDHVGRGRRGGRRQGAGRAAGDEWIGRVHLVGEDLRCTGLPKCRRRPSWRSGCPWWSSRRGCCPGDPNSRWRPATCSRGWCRRSRRCTSRRSRPRAACSPGRRWTHRRSRYPGGREGSASASAPVSAAALSAGSRPENSERPRSPRSSSVMISCCMATGSVA